MTKHRPDTDPGMPAIPDDNAPVPPARRGTRWTVGRLRAIAFVLVILAVAASLLSVLLTYGQAMSAREQADDVNERLSVLEQDLADRTHQRDAERDAAAERDAETREQVQQLLCDVLADLPAGSPSLDAVRGRLGCPEPGVTPSVADSPAAEDPTSTAAGAEASAGTPAPATERQQRANPPSGAASGVTPDPGAGGATAPDDEPPPVPPATPPQPAPAEPDREPVSDLACALLSLC